MKSTAVVLDRGGSAPGANPGVTRPVTVEPFVHDAGVRVLRRPAWRPCTRWMHRSRIIRAGVVAAAFVGALAPAAEAAQCAGTIYLTFDTGNMAQAEEIAQVLLAEQVRATFFVANEKTLRGDHALDASWAGYWRARVAEGHAFGNHTWSHHYQRRDLDGERLLAATVDGRPLELDRQAFCAELRKTDEAFHRLTGQHLAPLWRAPGGRTTQQSIRWAAGCGYPVHVGWDDAGFLGDDLPSDRHPNAALLSRALERLKTGDVTMMHLGVWQRREPLAGILRPLIQGLKAKRLCFEPLSLGAR